MKKITVILAISLLIFSCSSKDDAPNPVQEVVKPKLIAYTNGGAEEYNITYNNNFPINIEYPGANNIRLSDNFTYDSNSRIISSGIEKYSYNSNGLIYKIALDGSNDTSEIFYDSQSRIIKEVEIRPSYNNQNNTRHFTYTNNLLTQILEVSVSEINGTQYTRESKFVLNYDLSGNLSQLMDYIKNAAGVFELNGTINYEYDDKPNPWKELLIDKVFKDQFFISSSALLFSKASSYMNRYNGFLVYYISSNNLVKISTTFENPSHDYQIVYNCIYDNNGYITKSERIYTSVSVPNGDSRYFKYIYN